MKTVHELETERLLWRICLWLSVIWSTLFAGIITVVVVIAVPAR